MNTAQILEEAPSVTVSGVTVLHNTHQWRVCTNRHPTLYGSSWGWIEGAPGNVCWSNDKTFNQDAAGQMVADHNKWLEDQKPISIKLIEARERFQKAKKVFDSTEATYNVARADMEKSERVLADLQALSNEGLPSLGVCTIGTKGFLTLRVPHPKESEHSHE